MIQSLEIRVPEIERSFRCISYFYSFWESIRLDASPAGWSISIATDLKRDALTLFVGREQLACYEIVRNGSRRAGILRDLRIPCRFAANGTCYPDGSASSRVS